MLHQHKGVPWHSHEEHQLWADTLQVPARFTKYILPKGFVAVDGISLTVGKVGADIFSVYLIPETLRVTTLGSRKEGDAVNVEIEAQTQVLHNVMLVHTSTETGINACKVAFASMQGKLCGASTCLG